MNPVSPPPRSLLVTILGWLVIVGSALLSTISFISLLMIFVGSYGTSTSDPLGFLTVIVAPPVTFVAGIGLLRRWWWARIYMLALLLVVLGYNGYQFIRGPIPQHSYVSPGGVPTTVLASEAFYSIPVIVVCVGLLVILLTRGVRAEFAASRPSFPSWDHAVKPSASEKPRQNNLMSEIKRGWRVGHHGRDCLFYEELHGIAWQRIEISGEMLMGPTHHVIYFASAKEWKKYPDWANQHRDEIMARIKSEFREPDYKYYEDSNLSVSPRASATPATTSASRKNLPWQLLALVILLGISGGMFWLVNDGIGKGETTLPMKQSTHRRIVSRIKEPATFWLSIGVYATIGAGTLGLVLWGVRVALKDER